MSRSIIPIVAVEAAGAASVPLYVSEAKIQPRSVRGKFASWRWTLVWATQLVFYGLPWLQWNGRPALLFDLDARRFYVFAMVLHPQDVIYLAGLLVLAAFSLFLFTAVAGRLWCGFACPQTVYTEIFMWVERRFEGDRQARIKLAAAPWSATKLARLGGKQAVWLAIGLWTGFTFVAYFTPARTLFGEAVGLSLGPWQAFWLLFYGLATYGNAGYLREQVCKYMCPYARFQSAMFDRDTLIVSYDPERGEPRGSRARGVDPASIGKGQCIDCTLCVQVCPTGIDIRKGLQYECIGCAACVDVCDGVMDKMAYPRGLIRFATQNAMTQHWTARATWKRVARPRILLYGAVLLAIAAGFVGSLATRSPFKADVVRDRGALARMVDEGRIENVYRVQLMNATEHAERFHIDVEGLPGATVHAWSDVDLASTEARWVPIAVQMSPQAAQALGAGAHPFRFRIALVDPLRSDGHASDRDGESRHAALGAAPHAEEHEKSTFIVPR